MPSVTTTHKKIRQVLTIAPNCERVWQRRGEREADRQLLIQTEHKIPAQSRKSGSGGREES